MLAAGLALSILAGFMASALVVVIAAAIVSVVLVFQAGARLKFLAAVLCGWILGVGLAAIQLVPTYQLTGYSLASERAQALGSGGRSAGSESGLPGTAELLPYLHSIRSI